MRVIIPAAGRGTRLAPVTDTVPKGAVPIAGRPLLWHTMGQLYDAGVRHTVVVCGHHGDRLREALLDCSKRPALSFVTNTEYQITDSMFSLWLTRRWWNEPFCVLDGDLLVASALLHQVFQAVGDRLVVDTTRRYAQIEMHVEIINQSVTRLGNNLSVQQSSGEFFGLSRWTPHGASDILVAIMRRLDRGERTERYSNALNDIALRRPIATTQASRSDWAEVDHPDDISRAERLIRDWFSPRRIASAAGPTSEEDTRADGGW